MKPGRKHFAFIGIILLLPLVYWVLFHHSISPTPLHIRLSENKSPEIGDQALFLLESNDYSKTQSTLSNLEKKGGKAEHIFPPHVVIAKVPKDLERKQLQDENILDLFRTRVNAERLRGMDETTKLAVSVWNKQFEPKEGVETPPSPANKGAQEGVEPEPIYDDLRYIPIRPPQEKDKEKSKEINRQGEVGSPGGTLAPTPAPAPAISTPQFDKTSEYMIGSVAVGIVLPQSVSTAVNKSETWTAEREQQVISQVEQGFQWWIARDAEARGMAKLSFVYDIQLKVPTNHEPISTCSIDCNGDGVYDEGLWIQDVMNYLSTNLGFPITPTANYQRDPYFYAVRSYDNYLRQKYGTDWAVTVFVVDSFNDADGLFPDGYFAYTYAGGPFTIMTYDNQRYGITNMNAVMAHELGHDFYALDEYGNCSLTAKSGYLQVANGNCEFNNPNVVESIMRGQIRPYTNGALDYWARGQIGWWDVNNNGIYEPVDTVPLVSLDQCQAGCLTQRQLTVNDLIPVFSGVANDSQIKINQVLFRVDSGAWVDASAGDGQFNTSSESFRLQLSPQVPGAHLLEVKARTYFGGETQPPYSLNLNVVAPNPAVVELIAVNIQAPQTTFAAGHSTQLQAMGLYNNGKQEVLTTGLSWTTSNTAMSNIDQSGLFLGLAQGGTSVMVIWTGQNGERITSNPLSLTVTPYVPIELLSQNGSVVNSGSQVGITVKGGGDNLKASVLGPAYASSTPMNIVNGRIVWQIPSTGNFAGKYTINVQDQKINNQNATFTIDVPLQITPQVGNLPLGVEVVFQAQGSPGPFIWKINGESSPGIGSIDAVTGKFMGHGVGALTITATDASHGEINGTNKVFLVDTGKLLVKVLKAGDDTPISGARIDVRNLSTIANLANQATGIDGSSLLEGLPVQPLILTIFAPGFVPVRYPTTIWPVSSSTSPAIVEVRLEPAVFSITGQVHDLNGFGLERARVSVSGKQADNTAYSGDVLTDQLGQFTFGLPGAGSYALVASSSDYGNSTELSLPNLTGNAQGLTLLVRPYLYSVEDPVTKQTAVKILDYSGALSINNSTISLRPGSSSAGTFSILGDEPVTLNNALKTPSHLVSLYTPGSKDADGSLVEARISSTSLPAPGYMDYSFSIHPISPQAAIAAGEQTVNGRLGGLINLAGMNFSADRQVMTGNETSLFIPSEALPANYLDQAIKVKIVRWEGLSGTTWARYSFDLSDANGQPVTLPVLSLRQVNEAKRFIISMQADSSIFDPEAFLRGAFIVQYQVTPGGPLINDDSFKASVAGSSLIIETSHLSTWSLSPTLPLRSDTSQASGGGGGGGCFLATAAFGSFLESEVVMMRKFRDAFLINNPLGRWLVTWYYRVSPDMADFISHQSVIRQGVRVILYPVVGFSWLMVYAEWSWPIIFVSGIVALFLILFLRIFSNRDFFRKV